jgi:hypothetical protein
MVSEANMPACKCQSIAEGALAEAGVALVVAGIALVVVRAALVVDDERPYE